MLILAVLPKGLVTFACPGLRGVLKKRREPAVAVCEVPTSRHWRGSVSSEQGVALAVTSSFCCGRRRASENQLELPCH